MGFKWIIVVLLQTTFTKFVCSRMVANDSLSRKESVKSDIETNFQRSHAIISIQSEDGDIIDCIDIYKQPAFNHPALRDHKIQMNPNYEVKTENAADPKQTGTVPGQIWRRSGSCPKGTIPIRRIRNNNSNHARKQAMSFSYQKQFNDSKMLLLLRKNYSIAVLHTEGFAYLGAKGDIKVFNPRVESDDEYSTSQVALKNGYETMESGWAVNPSLYGDRQTRLFVYWTADGSNKTGCFDQTCPGFVQTSHEIALGAAIYPISHPPRGLPYEITIFIHKDPNTSNWWLQYGDQTNIGYWPPDLFDSLGYHAALVQWGGEVYSSRVGTRPHTSTAMGSGEFPDFIFQTSGSVKRIRVVENSLILRFPRWVNGYTDEYDCYQTYYLGDYVYDPEFYYGGPGSYRNPMCR